MASRKRGVSQAAEELKVPQTDEEADSFIAQVSQLDAERDQIQKDLDAEINQLKQEAAKKLEEKTGAIARLARGLNAYFLANQDRLTEQGKRRSHTFPSGDIGLRLGFDRVRLTDVRRITRYLLRRPKLRRMFLRMKFSVNKQAVKAHPAEATKVPGIRIMAGTDYFFVRPARINLEIGTDGTKIQQEEEDKDAA